ncbi:hypothetical protein OG883_03235 [Streptomyces sp. NBC_01142]|uniref:hypothetical protein n=1 Tax=Streptomyces sp. NBC_01142 TaxID=2975865 RepID=UPI002257B62D|nr:hypothetical protein [Streptomyces sp. NBC_01142]MCX4818933.1 hypothetical protein [Streptomyces sp. NBC_01142]
MPRAAAALATVLTAVVVLGGCGIRTTQVPVDAGPAPSRMPCEVSGADISPQAQPQGVPVRVYLVCASQLESVDRTAKLPGQKADDSRVLVARVLLDELQKEPSSPEHEAGFATYVRGPIVLTGPRKDDPAGTLRLSRQPEDLPAPALAQIVCTFAESRAATTSGSVLLGGPGDYAPRGYQCSTGTKERPEEALPTLGALPSSSASSTASPGSS